MCGISGGKLSESLTDFLFWLTSDPDDLFSFINDRMTNYAKANENSRKKKRQNVQTRSATFHDQDSWHQNNSRTHKNIFWGEKKQMINGWRRSLPLTHTHNTECTANRRASPSFILQEFCTVQTAAVFLNITNFWTAYKQHKISDTGRNKTQKTLYRVL